MYLNNVFEELVPIMIFTALVNLGKTSSLRCYRCGLTNEKLTSGVQEMNDWPDPTTARNVGMVECEDPIAKEFLISCPSSNKCHTIKWANGQFTPIRFCFPSGVIQSCEGVLTKLIGNATCLDCNEDGCNI